MKEKQNITIKIADVAPIGMSIDPRTEEVLRIAERNVNKVWSALRGQFEGKSPKEVLAMVAFQFAKGYYQLLQNVNEQEAVLTGFEAELDRLLEIGNTTNPDKASQQ